MGVATSIQWTDHTFNPWWGCTKVHQGCKNCYAETAAKRYGHSVWGPSAERRFFGEKHWNEPLKWNRDAEAEGRRRRVFCASMADVGESREDLIQPRERLWKLIEITPNLDWQILTKRPENIPSMMPGRWLGHPPRQACPPSCPPWQSSEPANPRGQPPRNVWWGTSPCDQATADASIPALLQIPAAVRFLSLEPLIGAIDLTKWISGGMRINTRDESGESQLLDYDVAAAVNRASKAIFKKFGGKTIDWVIVGGESGPGARRFDLTWGKYLVGQCKAAGVPVFVKQIGGNAGWIDADGDWHSWHTRDRKGGNPAEWPQTFECVREFPEVAP